MITAHVPLPASHSSSFHCCLDNFPPFPLPSTAILVCSNAASSKVTLGRALWQFVVGCHVLASCQPGVGSSQGSTCLCLALGQEQEAGDLCRSLRQCWGLSCARQPGPSSVQGWIFNFRLTAPYLHPWVCGLCGFLGAHCHCKLPVPLIPPVMAAKEQ